MWDPNEWDLEARPVARIYDADHERFAIVDEKYFSALVTMRDTNPERTGKLMPRRWVIKPMHPKRNGRKLYFVSNAGWRQGGAVFLHVAVMRLTGREPPTPKHKLVNHIDGVEWNCTEANLEWATHVGNRRKSKQPYKKPVAL